MLVKIVSGNPHILLVGMKNVSHCLKRVWWYLDKINVELPFDPANLLDSSPREKKKFIHTHLYTDVHVSTINDTSVPKHKMDKNTYNGLLLSHKNNKVLIPATVWINLEKTAK